MRTCHYVTTLNQHFRSQKEALVSVHVLYTHKLCGHRTQPLTTWMLMYHALWRRPETAQVSMGSLHLKKHQKEDFNTDHLRLFCNCFCS